MHVIQAVKTLKDMCLHESWKVSKFASRTLLRLRDSGEEIQAVVKTSLAALSLTAQLPAALAALSEVAIRAPSLLSSKDNDKILTVCFCLHMYDG